MYNIYIYVFNRTRQDDLNKQIWSSLVFTGVFFGNWGCLPLAPQLHCRYLNQIDDILKRLQCPNVMPTLLLYS